MDATDLDACAPPAPWLAYAMGELHPNIIGPGSGDARATARVLLRSIERDDLPTPEIRPGFAGLLTVDFLGRERGLRLVVNRAGDALAHVWTPVAAFPGEAVAWDASSGGGRDVRRFRELVEEAFPAAPATSNDIIVYLCEGNSRVVR